MDRPVGAPGLTELPGAIQRVHDPDPVGRQPRPVVAALLGQDRVTRPARRQFGGEELVGEPVSRLAQIAGIASLGTQPEQQRPGLLREFSGKAIIVGCHEKWLHLQAWQGTPG